MFVQISKGQRRKKEDKEPPKTDPDDSDTPEETTPPPEVYEEFSTVELPTSNEMEITKPPSKGDQFIDRFKKSSVGKLFKSDSKDSEISIYTLDQVIGRPNHEDVLRNSELKAKQRRSLYHESSDTLHHSHVHSVASQANPYPPYRLYFLPPIDWKENDSKLLTISKLILCQCSLACFLLFWLISTAVLLYLTEGPQEYQLVTNLKHSENSTMVSLINDLMIEDSDWNETLTKYMESHREEILEAVRNGYNSETKVWTFPGSLLSAVSIMTTLGLAAPLPVTSEGKIGALIFSCFGLPIHIVLIIHLGRTIALKIQLFAKEIENKVVDLRQRIINVRRFGEDRKRETWPEKMFMVDFTPPSWLCFFPPVSYFLYYTIGLLVFGMARNLPTSEVFIFFVNFSRGEPSNGFARMGYSWYLEGLAILTGINIAIIRDTPIPGFASLAEPHGLLTNSID